MKRSRPAASITLAPRSPATAGPTAPMLRGAWRAEFSRRFVPRLQECAPMNPARAKSDGTTEHNGAECEKNDAAEQPYPTASTSKGAKTASESRPPGLMPMSLHRWWTRPEWWLVILAAVAAASGLASLRFFYDQLKAVQNASVAGERARLGLSGPVKIQSVDDDRNLRVTAQYPVKNFGHGPAFDVSSYFVVTPKGRASSAAFGICEFARVSATRKVRSEMEGYTSPGTDLFPGQTSLQGGFASGPPVTSGPTDLIGCIAYKDQFGTLHWTRFCMQSQGTALSTKTVFFTCTQYNDTDDMYRHAR